MNIYRGRAFAKARLVEWQITVSKATTCILFPSIPSPLSTCDSLSSNLCSCCLICPPHLIYYRDCQRKNVTTTRKHSLLPTKHEDGCQNVHILCDLDSLSAAVWLAFEPMASESWSNSFIQLSITIFLNPPTYPWDLLHFREKGKQWRKYPIPDLALHHDTDDNRCATKHQNIQLVVTERYGFPVWACNES